MSQEISTNNTTPMELSNTESPQLVNEDIEMTDGESSPDQVQNELSLPLSKIKKIIKMDPEYQGASASAVYATGLATELFIQYLSESAYFQAKMEKRKKIQYKDFANAVSSHDQFTFLSDTIPKTQPIGDLIQKKKVNLTKEQKLEKAETAGQDMSGKKELEKGQQTLSFASVADKPIKKAGINDLVSAD